jgi:AraC-like DNA-binding protein
MDAPGGDYTAVCNLIRFAYYSAAVSFVLYAVTKSLQNPTMSISELVPQIEVRAFGARRRESDGFAVDRPNGFHETIWVRLHDHMQLRIGNTAFTVQPGTVILIPPGTPHWYTSVSGSWCNDWLHIVGSDIEDVCRIMGHPIGEPFLPIETSHVSPHFETIARDLARKDDMGKSLASIAVLSLLVRTVAACNMPDTPWSAAEAVHRPAFDRLRQRMLANLDHPWDIANLAREVHLGVSRFSELYLRFYGVSAIEDLLQARIRAAESLLTNASLTVSEVALRTGFASHAYFSRTFRARVGISPMEYRRRGLLS